MRSNGNRSDIMTKNLLVNTFKKEANKILEGNIVNEVMHVEQLCDDQR